MNTKSDREEQLMLELLDAVGKQKDVSQRHLASQMGVALGLANSYLKRCIRKGLVKITQAPANRYLYYLTPKGFAEKSRLTIKYLHYSLEFYRRAGESCARVFKQCHAKKYRRVLLGGCSDLAEIATLRAHEYDIEVVGVYDKDSDRERLAGKPVWRRVDAVIPFDVCVLTDLKTPLLTYRSLCAEFGDEKLLVPDILSFE
jgi:DNA-binding MarR family transcriptional regulator